MYIYNKWLSKVVQRYNLNNCIYVIVEIFLMIRFWRTKRLIFNVLKGVDRWPFAQKYSIVLKRRNKRHWCLSWNSVSLGIIEKLAELIYDQDVVKCMWRKWWALSKCPCQLTDIVAKLRDGFQFHYIARNLGKSILRQPFAWDDMDNGM